MDVVLGPDGLARCRWATTSDDYREYHDTEWGRPVHGDRALLERICLEGFQAGLSWLTILRKRPAFRRAFAGFDPVAVADFDDGDVDRLLGDADIVRHRGKIEAAVRNARAVVALHEQGDTLEAIVWSHAPAGRPRPARLSDIPAATAESTRLSRELKRRGFAYVGPTTMYAAMQACGLVDDHLADCQVPDRP